MGRKIPGRKHRGVRDPEKQRQQRLAKIKDKINAPPRDPDEQHTPKSLLKIMELKNKVKNGNFSTTKKKHRSRVNNETKRDQHKPVPKFEQYPGESDRVFLNRVNSICQNVKKEAAFEKKYNVEIRHKDDGNVEVVKRKKDELEIYLKKIRKEKKQKKRKVNSSANDEVKLTKSQKWSLKKAERKKKNKLRDVDDFSKYKDHVKFGERVDAPPTLVAPRKAPNVTNTLRPGKRELLLKSVIADNNKVKSKNEILSQKTGAHKEVNAINRRGKRKDLPHAVRRQLDKQQKEVIEAYKKLKIKKYVNTTTVE